MRVGGDGDGGGRPSVPRMRKSVAGGRWREQHPMGFATEIWDWEPSIFYSKEGSRGGRSSGA